MLTVNTTSTATVQQGQHRPRLAAGITRAASQHTYYTVRFLVDRDRVADAYRAYAYFRWVDDQLDGSNLDTAGRLAFVEQQAALVERCYQGDKAEHLRAEERLLADLVAHDRDLDSGLRSYIHNMMAVMAFDAGRRGQLVTEAELNDYTRWLATAVTEALHYFIGHDCHAPQGDVRHLAAAGAHITHMLRDTLEDVEAGYFNIPREWVEAGGIDPGDVESATYRAWVMNRVQLARAYFEAGRAYLARVESTRCRLAGYAYMARFEDVLGAIEREDYHLRASYPECKAFNASLRMAQSALAGMLARHAPVPVSHVQSGAVG